MSPCLLGANGRMSGGVLKKGAVCGAVLDGDICGVVLATGGVGGGGVEGGLEDGDAGMGARDGGGLETDVDVLAADGAAVALHAAEPVAGAAGWGRLRGGRTQGVYLLDEIPHGCEGGVRGEECG